MKEFKRWRRWLFAILCLVLPAVLFERWCAHRESSQDAVILAAAARYGVEPALVKAVVWRESWFNPEARGRKGEIGLMQIRKDAAEEWAKSENVPQFAHVQLFDPAKNTLAGAWYLRKLLRRYPQADDPLPYALADYNAGRTHVLQWNKGTAATNGAAFVGQIEFPSTKKYVNSVMKRYRHYRPDFPPEKQAKLSVDGRGAPGSSSR